MGGWTFQVGLVGRDTFLKNIFLFFLVAKMTPLKYTKIFQKSNIFLEKTLEKNFS